MFRAGDSFRRRILECADALNVQRSVTNIGLPLVSGTDVSTFQVCKTYIIKAV